MLESNQVLGWASRPLETYYEVPPTVLSDLHGASLTFWRSHEELVYPITVEVYVSRILDWDEMRALCDRHRTQGAIIDHLI